MEFEYVPPEYSPKTGLRLDYHGDFRIVLTVEQSKPDARKTVVIAANRDGLITWAKHMITLAQAEVPGGCHFHMDAGEVLEGPIRG